MRYGCLPSASDFSSNSVSPGPLHLYIDFEVRTSQFLSTIQNYPNWLSLSSWKADEFVLHTYLVNLREAFLPLIVNINAAFQPLLVNLQDLVNLRVAFPPFSPCSGFLTQMRKLWSEKEPRLAKQVRCVRGVLSRTSPMLTRPQSFWLVAQPSKSAAHRDKSQEWNVSKQKWILC